MTALDMTLGFGLGLAGSLHCVQMCGPIVLAWCIPSNASGEAGSHLGQAAGQGFYHVGRIATYALLGALAGAFGQAIRSLARWETAASLAAGLLLVLAGLLMAGAVRRPQLVHITPAAGVTRRAARWLHTPTPLGRLRLGLLLGFLPCGFIYAALLQAMAPGNPIDGALTMAAFGLGTAGPLFAVGLGSGALAPWLRRFGGQRLAAVSMLALGVFLILRGLSPVAMAGGGHHH